jgi:hypothetical protein
MDVGSLNTIISGDPFAKVFFMSTLQLGSRGFKETTSFVFSKENPEKIKKREKINKG